MQKYGTRSIFFCSMFIFRYEHPTSNVEVYAFITPSLHHSITPSLHHFITFKQTFRLLPFALLPRPVFKIFILFLFSSFNDQVDQCDQYKQEDDTIYDDDDHYAGIHVWLFKFDSRAISEDLRAGLHNHRSGEPDVDYGIGAKSFGVFDHPGKSFFA